VLVNQRFYAILEGMKKNTSNLASLISLVHSESALFLEQLLAQKGFEGFASSHGNILHHLSLQKKMTMSEITHKINRDKSTTTVLIRKLEQQGYINREVSSEDLRVTYIVLSEKGKRAIQATKEISRKLNKTCLANFSDEEIETLSVLLNRILHNFQRERENSLSAKD